MASAPKPLKTLAGNTPPGGTAGNNPAIPLNGQTVNEAILQLQTTVNELITRLNTHTHSAGAVAAPDAATRVQGVAVAATNLFNDN